MSRKAHWDAVYAQKAPASVSWYQPRADLSLKLVGQAGIGHSAGIIDVGAGASVLVDGLLDEGYRNLTALDLSGAALDRTRVRLGERAGNVTWIESDVTVADLPAGAFDLWHDRAVFHFLVDPGDRRAYLQALQRALRPGGHVIIATFAEDGPERCSGLPVRRYSPGQLHAELGEGFTLLHHEHEAHLTPGGTVQRFQYSLFRASKGRP